MTTASNNNFTQVILTEGSTPSSPSSGYQKLFVASSDHHLKRVNSSGTVTDVDASHAYYQYLAAALDPGAIESVQSGSFAYTVNSSTTKLLLASFATKLGSTGRMEIRDPKRLMPLRGVTLNGLGSTSAAVIIDPTLPTYTDARSTYFSRMQTLMETSLRQVDVVAPATNYPFLLGAYGGIILRAVNFDFDYISVQNVNTTFGYNLMNEENDSVAQREDSALTLALNKYVATELYAGAERSAGVGRGTVVFILCPSTWSGVTDSNSYSFRDDFMGSSLDTTTNWTRAQTGGTCEIDTTYQWLKTTGDGTWGHNGCYSKTGIARANGKIFQCDVYTGRNSSANNAVAVGFSDGAGQSYTNFSHSVIFTSSAGVNQLKVFENGNDRGAVGSGYTNGTIYRVKITLGSSNNCTYQIQGGAYGALGSASFTTLSPSSNSSSTTPLYAGVSNALSGTMYISDAKIY